MDRIEIIDTESQRFAAASGEAAAGAARAGAGEPTAVVTGPVEDLALWAWTRGGTVEITGEPESLAAVDALIGQGIQ